MAFLDADDVWLPRRLERMVDRLLRQEVEAVLCATWVTDESLQRTALRAMSPTLSSTEMLLGSPSLVSTSSNLLITRESVDAVGGFDEDLSTSADWYLLFRIVDGLPWDYEAEALVLYREHAGGMSRDVGLMAQDMLRSYERIFAGASAERLAHRGAALSALHRTLAGSYFVIGRYRAFTLHAVKSLLLGPQEVRYFTAAAYRSVQRQAMRRSGREKSAGRQNV